MKLRHTIVFLTLPFLSAGCTNDQLVETEANSWEISSNSSVGDTAAPSVRPASDSAAEQERSEQPVTQDQVPKLDSSTMSGDVIAELNGDQFRVKEEPEIPKGADFVRAHYFEATATVDLSTTSTLVETELEGQNREGALPVVGMYVQTTDGRRLFAVEGRPIDGAQILKDKVKLPAGNYVVRITYFKDTVGQIRPRVTLRKVTFRR